MLTRRNKLQYACWLMCVTPLNTAADATDDIVRTQNTIGLVHQAGYILMASTSDSDDDGYQEALAQAAGASVPTGGGVIPSSTAAPKNDGWGKAFGYCSIDNGSVRTSTGRIAGPATPAQSNVTMAVVSAGLNGTFDSTCAGLQGGTIGGDDIAVYYSNAQVSIGSFGTASVWNGRPVSSSADLNSLDTTALTNGETRLVLDSGLTYYYTAGIGWQPVAFSIGSTQPANGLFLSAANTVGISTNNVNRATIDASGDLNLLTGGLQVNGVTVVDASRNVTGAQGTFSGTVTADGGLLVNGVTVVDASRNVSATGLFATTLSIGGSQAIDASRNWVGSMIGYAKGGTGVTTTPTNGQLLIGNGSGYTLAGLSAGTGISVTNGPGSITVSNTGVTSLAGSAGQVQVSNATGAVTLSLPQSIDTLSTPQFAGLKITANGTLAWAPTWGRTITLPDVSGTAITTGNLASITSVGNITSGTWNGSTIGVPRGGLGTTTLAANGLLYGNGVNAVGVTAAGTAGQLLIANASGVPAFASLSGDATLGSTGALTLANSGVTAGTYNNSTTAITPLTVDAKGRITGTGAAVTITPAWGSVTGVPAAITSYAALMNQNVRTTDAPTFAGLVVNRGASTTAVSPLALTQTWNAAAVTFPGITFNVTDTASAANSRLLALQVGGTDKFVVTKAGNASAVTLESTVATGTAPLTVASTTLVGNLNADLLDGQHGSYYRDVGNINAGILPVPRGGLGTGTLTANGVLYGNGVNAVGVTAAGTAGQLLIANASGVPAFASLSGDATLGSTGALTLANSGVTAGTYNNSAMAITPFTVDAKGRITGTGAAVTITPAWGSVTGVPANVSQLAGISGANGMLPYFTGAGTLAGLAAGTSGQFLKSSGAAAPAWAGIAQADVAGLTTASTPQFAGLKLSANGTLAWAPTVARTITLPDVSGTAITTGNLASITSVGNITSGTWNGSTIGVPRGGLGTTTLTSRGLLYGNGTNAVGVTAAGTAGQLLVANDSKVPTFVSMSGDATLGSTGALTLVNSGVTAAKYNDSATAITPLTIDAKGRVTATGTAVTITPAWGSVTGVPAAITSYAALMNQNVRTTDAPTFAGLVINRGASTTAVSPLALTQTWNASAITFPGITFNVTDTASAANSRLLALQVGGTDRFVVTKAGNASAVTLESTVATGTAPLTVASTTVVGNLNADLLDGQHGSYYRDAGNINVGILPVPRGGTGASTLAANGVLYGNGVNAVGVTAEGAVGQLLVANDSKVPTFVSMSGDATLGSTGALTLANSGVTAAKYNDSATAITPLTIDAKGRVTATGTAVTITPAWGSITAVPANVSQLAGISGANGMLPYFTGAGTLAGLAAGTSGQFLKSSGAAAPAWAGIAQADVAGLTTASTPQFAGLKLSANGTLAWAPTVARTITLPDVSGTAITTGNLASITSVGNITSGTWNGSTIGVPRGGTGATTLAANGLLYGNGTNAVGVTAAGTAGQLLIANASAVPAFTSLSGDATLSSTGSLTITDDSHNHVISNVDGLQSALDRRKLEYTAIVRPASWSRIARFDGQQLFGSVMLTLRHTRNNVVVGNTFLVTFGHSNSGQLVLLGSHGYSQVKARLTSVGDGNNVYFEVYDDLVG